MDERNDNEIMPSSDRVNGTPSPAASAGAPEPANGTERTEGGSLGSFITDGVSAVREMSAAKRAHAAARDELDDLLDAIEEKERELDHRRDVEQRYEQIIAEQTAERDESSRTAVAAEDAAAKAKRELDALEDRLKTMKADDDRTEKRLRDAHDDASGSEELAAKALDRARKRLKEANEALDAAVKARSEGTAAAQRRIDDVTMRMSKLEGKLADLDRNPSSNTAEYDTRRRELMASINEAGAALAEAKNALPGVIDAATTAVVDAQREIVDAEQPIAKLEAAHQAAKDAEERARDELDDARDDADERQRTLKDEISEKRRELRDQETAAEKARKRASAAEALVAEANDIHAHPEVTDTLAAELRQDYIERDSRQQAVETLAENERGVRARTRGKRAAFGAAIAVVAVLVVAVVALIVMALNG